MVGRLGGGGLSVGGSGMSSFAVIDTTVTGEGLRGSLGPWGSGGSAAATPPAGVAAQRAAAGSSGGNVGGSADSTFPCSDLAEAGEGLRQTSEEWEDLGYDKLYCCHKLCVLRHEKAEPGYFARRRAEVAKLKIKEQDGDMIALLCRGLGDGQRLPPACRAAAQDELARVDAARECRTSAAMLFTRKLLYLRSTPPGSEILRDSVYEFQALQQAAAVEARDAAYSPSSGGEGEGAEGAGQGTGAPQSLADLAGSKRARDEEEMPMPEEICQSKCCAGRCTQRLSIASIELERARWAEAGTSQRPQAFRRKVAAELLLSHGLCNVAAMVVVTCSEQLLARVRKVGRCKLKPVLNLGSALASLTV